MIRLLVFVVFLGALAFGLSWFADQPGTLVLNWMGYQIETSFYVAFLVVFLLLGFVLIGWSVLRHVVGTPAAVYRFFDTRRRKRGMDALSSGLIAISAGDRAQATKFANQARQALPNDPMTALLRAQTAQLCGDRATSRRIYASMIEAPDTELLGLRGLFLEAQFENETEAARQFAERAMRRDPKLEWAVEALFGIQCKSNDWDGALETLAIARANKHFDKKDADRKRAVLLTAQAVEAEDEDMDRALSLALDSHKLSPELTPAAAIAGRILASKGQTSKAAKVISKSWKLAPHPDLALIYAHLRPGDATRDRLKRAKELVAMKPHNVEGRVAVANAAIEAVDFDEAREALRPLVVRDPSQRVCTLMARIEAGEHGDKGRVREWLARGLRAPRDPAWTADGYVSDHWQPVSPLSGQLDAFAWRVPVEAMEAKAMLDESIDEFLALEKATAAGVLLDNMSAESSGVDEQKDVVVVAEESKVEEAVEPAPDVEPKPDPSSLPVVPATGKNVVSKDKSGEVPADDDAVPEKAELRAVDDDGVTAEATGQSGTKDDADRQNEERPKNRKQRKRARGGGAKPKIFVPPRAPDDPGPEPSDVDEARTPLARFRMPSPKGSS